MKATDLCLAFEQEWIPKYPDLLFFMTETVVQDICYLRKVEITQEQKKSLSSFLIRYLKEHPTRFVFSGISGFRITRENILGY